MAYYTKFDDTALVQVTPTVYSTGDVAVSKGTPVDKTISELGTLVATAAIPLATTAVAGKVKQAVAQADTVAVDLTALKADFNALLAKLRTAGILAV